MVAIPLVKKGNRDPLASRSQATVARYDGHSKVIIQGDSEHALMAEGSRCMRVNIRDTTNLTHSKGPTGAAEREPSNPLKVWLEHCVLMCYTVQALP